MKFGLRKFALDTALAIMVFVPLAAVWNRFVAGIADWQVIAATVLGTFVINLATGGFYGRLLDAWRAKLNY